MFHRLLSVLLIITSIVSICLSFTQINDRIMMAKKVQHSAAELTNDKSSLLARHDLGKSTVTTDQDKLQTTRRGGAGAAKNVYELLRLRTPLIEKSNFPAKKGYLRSRTLNQTNRSRHIHPNVI